MHNILENKLKFNIFIFESEKYFQDFFKTIETFIRKKKCKQLISNNYLRKILIIIKTKIKIILDLIIPIVAISQTIFTQILKFLN